MTISVTQPTVGTTIQTNEIDDGAITNAKVNAAAAIVGSKLDLTSGTGAITSSGAISTSTSGSATSFKAFANAGQTSFAGRQVAGDVVLANRLLDGDANQSFQIKGDGTFNWGAGGASAPDVTFKRTGVGELSLRNAADNGYAGLRASYAVLSSTLGVTGVLTASSDLNVTGALNVTGNSAFSASTTVTRAVSGNFCYTAQVTGDTQKRFIVTTDGGMLFGDGATAGDMRIVPTGVGATGTLALLANGNTRIKIDNTGIGFFNVGPAARPGATADIKAGLATLGLLTAGGATPLNLEGGVITAVGTGLTGVPDGALSANVPLLNAATNAYTGKATYAAVTGNAITTAQLAAQKVLQQKVLVGDTQPAFNIYGDGSFEWGVGGSTAVDTNLYRTAAGVLQTDFTLSAKGATSFQASQAGDTVPRIALLNTGQINFGPGGSTAADITTIRSAAGVVTQTSAAAGGSRFQLKGGSTGNANTAYFEFIDSGGTSKGYVGDASNADSNIYVSSIAGNVQLRGSDTAMLTASSTSVAIVGRLGINNVTPPAQAADTGAMATTGATQVTPFGFTTANQANEIATHINDIRACLRNLGAMA